MRFVVFSDMHFFDWSLGSSTTKYGIGSRLYSQFLVVEQIQTYCKINNIKHVFFCGDLFHTHDSLSAKTLHWALRAIQLLTDNYIQVYMTPGNHDMADRSGRYTSLSAFSMPYCAFMTHEGPFSVDGVTMQMIGYKNDRAELLSWLDNDNVDFLFLHQGVSGEPMPSGFVIPDEILKPSDIPDTVKMAFTGHYHNHKIISPNLTIVGAPLQHTWGDAGQTRGWIDYDTETGEMLHIESKAPKFLNNPEPGTDVTGHFVRTTCSTKEHEKAAYIQVLTEEEVPVTIHNLELPTDLSPVALTRKYAEHAKLNDNLTAIGIALAEGTYVPGYTGD